MPSLKKKLSPKSPKVLTFGWEFPPHITGGLGTACYGLTKSLLDQGTEILFVVPRANGDEEVKLINASEVVISERPSEEDPACSKSVQKKKIQVIPVAAQIRPYSLPGRAPSTTFEEWNYVIEESEMISAGKKDTKVVGRQYRFSGSYGPALFEEVARYGEVGGAIAGRHEFDLIHAHDWLTFPAGIAAKKASNKPLIVHVHATEYDRAQADQLDPRVLAIEREGLEGADHIVAVSEWTKNILVSKYGIAREKIRVVHNGVLREKPIAEKTKPSRLGDHLVTFLGRVTYQKGPQFFVEAARKVLQKFPDTHFVVAGAGDLLPLTMERVAALRLSSRFHFTGFLKKRQVNQIWSVTDVYVMPSVSEPFGISPLEAAHAGVPVIVSNQSGVSEVMPHAIKADFWDTRALASAICSVLQHKSLSKTLRRSSKETLKKITWDKAARKLNHLYDEVRVKRG